MPAQAFDSQTGQPEVDFRLDSVGAKQFADVTTQHTGHRFAIVLDKQVISAPVIETPILGGSGRITGAGSVQDANDLLCCCAPVLSSWPLKIIEERTVGAALGAIRLRLAAILL